MDLLKKKTFHGSWMGKNRANVAALREMAAWLEKNPDVNIDCVVASADEDMFLFDVYYKGETDDSN